MAFEPILQEILSHCGIEAVMFVDSEGETIHCCGRYAKDQLQVIGACQGIVLSAVGRAGLESEGTVVTLYDRLKILTRRLKDGYFISVIFSNAHFGAVQFSLEDFCRRLEREL